MGGQGQSGQAIKLFQAPRKITFTFLFDMHKSFILDDVKLAELSNDSFEIWMKEYDIFSGATYFPAYFQGTRPPWSTPWQRGVHSSNARLC